MTADWVILDTDLYFWEEFNTRYEKHVQIRQRVSEILWTLPVMPLSGDDMLKMKFNPELLRTAS